VKEAAKAAPSCAFGFFAHDSHAEGAHSRERMVFAGILLPCTGNRFPICLPERRFKLLGC